MDKYEYRVKTEQMLEHMEHKRYKKAMEIADTIDWKRVKNPSILNSVSEIYEYNGEFKKSRDVLFMAYDRAPNSRKTVYRLGTLALKINDIEEASDCYEEFVKLAPKDPNQFILKYKILKARRAPLAEQIDALEEFKKAEYIEKWAYELARLYDQAGMTAECLEECDDLILWFSEGRYVYQAMELKMKYKPLTPLQQERYESQKSGIGISVSLTPDEPKSAEPAASADGESVEDIVARMMSSVGSKISDATNPDMKPVMAEDDDDEETPANEAAGQGNTGGFGISGRTAEPERALPEEDAQEPKVRGESNIRKTVKGATLAEALRNGFAVANGINLEPKTKAIDKRDEDLRITGQMKIEEILMEWEAKQRENARAIDSQRKKDEEARAKEKLEAEKRREEEARRIEKQQRAAEEARRHAEQREVEKKRRLAARKAEEERILAEQKAEEERRQAILKAEEEERILERLAAGKAVQDLGDSLEKQTEEDVFEENSYEESYEEIRGETDGADEEMQEEELEAENYEEPVLDEFEDESYEDVIEDEFEDESYEETAEDEFEDESYEEAAEDEFEDESYEEAAEDEFEDESYEEAEDEMSYDYDDDDLEDFFADQEELQESTGMTADLRKLMEELEAGMDETAENESGDEAYENRLEEETYAEATEDEFEEETYEEEAGNEFEEETYEEEAGNEFEDESYEEAAEDRFEEEPYEEAAEDEFEEETYEEAAGNVSNKEAYEETEVDDFEEDYVGNYDEEGYGDDAWDDFEEDDFEEEPAGDEEDEFEEEELPIVEEPEPVKPVKKKKTRIPEKKPEVKAPKAPKVPKKVEELTIEEPTEEEIQKRIKKGKGGVPFDTGFVVTGRYDLSATSEIGLRAGLTEEQKKLFSYFVPVRGMSEQIVEVLDNDRREKREGTSRTGNIIVMGQKGSGKTVLAVDIVKAIQKQRNLKQGKVAIVTGESLNKKELTSIIQKLRGGAIIIEKAGKLNTRTIKELSRLMEKKTGELLVVLEDQKKPLERIFMANPSFKKKFTSKLELPAFINDELVTFGQTYAKESGYKLDEMGILALYSRIDVMQREDHSVTVAEVKEIMDEAIEHSKKANVKHFARRVFGKGTDDSDRIILKEDDFRI